MTGILDPSEPFGIPAVGKSADILNRWRNLERYRARLLTRDIRCGDGCRGAECEDCWRCQLHCRCVRGQ